MFRRATVVVGIAVVSMFILACQQEKSLREQLVEANRLALSGETDAARQLFERLLDEHPDDPDVLNAMAGFAIDRGEMDAAREYLERLEEQELSPRHERMVAESKRRYYTHVYQEARGDGPTAPGDAEAYEAALIELVNLDRGGAKVDEYVEFLLVSARTALGAGGEARIHAEDPNSVVHTADLDAMKAAHEFLTKLTEGDERLDVRPMLEDPVSEEVTALLEVLDRRIPSAEFDAAWSGGLREQFVGAERFQTEGRRFVLTHEGALPEEIAQLPEEAQEARAVLLARELATDLAYEFRETERGDAEPLGFIPADFAQAEVIEWTATDEGVTARVAIPYATGRKGWVLLGTRLAEAEAAEAAAEESEEGSGDDAPSDGEGDEAAPEGTGAAGEAESEDSAE